MDPLEKIKSLNGLTTADNSIDVPLKFHDNTQYTLTVKIKEEADERKYILKSKSDWTWKTSFGANAVMLLKHDKFHNNNGVVQSIEDRKKFDLLPSIMFTFMNFQNNWSPGFTAGLGSDFNKISFFTGFSLGIGQNIIITAGGAFHEQLRPDSDFSIGQSTDPALTDDKPNKEYYRFNPFVGITFNLNGNPFKKEEHE